VNRRDEFAPPSFIDGPPADERTIVKPLLTLPFEGMPADPAPRVENRERGARTQGMSFPNRETQFKPGQSGNPGGRPKGTTLTKLICGLLERDKLKDVPLETGQKVADALAYIIVKKAIEGDYRFVELVMNRIDGKVANTIAIDTNETTELIRSYLFGAADAIDPAG
jgi:hypothetical protein